MNKFTVSIFSFFILISAGLFNASSYAEPANLSLLTEKVKSYHDSGEYHKELSAVIQKARSYINCRAKENSKSPDPKKLAIVLDIDETSVSNYKYMVAREFVATHEQLHREIMAADAPAIKPMLSLYKDAVQHNITVFFVTGRKESERQATRKNLMAVGFHKWAGLYLKPNNYNMPSVINFKSKARAAIEHKGYTIIANIGDQFSDLKGGFSEKSYKLPNPYYYLP